MCIRDRVHRGQKVARRVVGIDLDGSGRIGGRGQAVAGIVSISSRIPVSVCALGQVSVSVVGKGGGDPFPVGLFQDPSHPIVLIGNGPAVLIGFLDPAVCLIVDVGACLLYTSYIF